MWQCPKCKSDNLDVAIKTWARLDQNEDEDFSTDADEAQFNDHEWDENSSMQCRECGHCDASSLFAVPEEPELPQIMFTAREACTVLAALRHWQRLVTANDFAKETSPDHFEDVEPLTDDEIDALCERITIDWLPDLEQGERMVADVDHRTTDERFDRVAQAARSIPGRTVVTPTGTFCVDVRCGLPGDHTGPCSEDPHS